MCLLSDKLLRRLLWLLFVLAVCLFVSVLYIPIRGLLVQHGVGRSTTTAVEFIEAAEEKQDGNVHTSNQHPL